MFLELCDTNGRRFTSESQFLSLIDVFSSVTTFVSHGLFRWTRNSSVAVQSGVHLSTVGTLHDDEHDLRKFSLQPLAVYSEESQRQRRIQSLSNVRHGGNQRRLLSDGTVSRQFDSNVSATDDQPLPSTSFKYRWYRGKRFKRKLNE